MVHVVVPTLNAAADWPHFSAALTACCDPARVLVIDSASTDGTPDLALSSGFQVCSIRRSEFNHGGTRQMAVEMLTDATILVFLTQDAILFSPDALKALLEVFRDPIVAVAYGRQLPRQGAGAIEAHARMFNYPGHSAVREFSHRDQLGFKTIFVSNSFAAYRRSALMEVGGFPCDTIFGEDTITAATLLLAGYKIAYVAEAEVYHSHSHTRLQDFKRYFDIGVLHNRERWLLDNFGGTGGEGRRFVVSELTYLAQKDALKIPDAMLRSALKYIAYRTGKAEHNLPLWIKRRISMNSRYWSQGR